MPHQKKHCSIEDMDQLLDLIDSFEVDLNKAQKASDPIMYQEQKLFNDYLRHRIQDMKDASVTELRLLSKKTT